MGSHPLNSGPFSFYKRSEPTIICIYLRAMVFETFSDDDTVVVQDLFDEVKRPPTPQLETPSSILSMEQVEELVLHLPPRCLGSTWSLAYGTDQHGFSLSSLYRSVNDLEGPCLLVVKEMNTENIFGGLLSHSPRVSENFFGTGQSWLFTYREGPLCVFPWAGTNSCFISCSTKSLVVGSDPDGFGLWLDQDLHRGSSSSVQTFNNRPLTETQDFTVQSLELWVF